ncbi:MAG: hypothetical protein AAGF11_51035 [Myxococcota bacterium]
MGSRSLPRVRASYNEAISQSADQQMLLNIVRLRYLHSTTFLQLGSVVTQYSLTADIGASGSYNPGAGGGPLPLGSVGGAAGVAVTERPTITYVPLQGEQFVRQVATPLRAEQVLMLIQSGWGADLVLTTCVRRINGVYAPRGSSREQDRDYLRLADLLYSLQRSHQLTVYGSERGPVVSVRPPGEELSADAIEALALLGLSPDLGPYPVVEPTAEPLPGTIAVEGRSVLGTMFYLAEGVDTPAGDPAAWGVGGAEPRSPPRLRVRSVRRQPQDAYVAVRYRERWFYVDESDRESKRAFALLMFLFNLTAASHTNSPLLTVGTGG